MYKRQAHESYTDHHVTVIDPSTWQRITIIPLLHPPYSLTWDAHNGRLLVSHPARNAVSIVDVESGRVAAIAATAMELLDLEVDPERGHVYIIDRAGRLRVLDSDTDVELAILMAQGSVSVDGPHGRLYTGSRERDVPVRVFDAGRLEQIGIIPLLGSEPVADPHSGGLYLVRDGVYIASLETMTVTGVLSDTLPPPERWNPSPRAVGATVDPGTGRLFVVMNTGSTSTSVASRETPSTHTTAMIAMPDITLLLAAHSHSAITMSSSSSGALSSDSQVRCTCMRENAEYSDSKLATIALFAHTEPAARKTMYGTPSMLGSSRPSP